MKHEEGTRMYKADDGNFIIRIADNFTMGDAICLGLNDSIDNYREEPFTEEQRNEFFKRIGMPDPKKMHKRLNMKN